MIVLMSNAVIGQTPRVAAAIRKIPLNGKTAADFLPPGWEIYNEATEDLDGDNVIDSVITLTLPLAEAEKLKEASGDNYQAPPSIVVVLFGKPGGGYRRFAVNGRLYPDSADERSYLSNSISKGVLSINTNWGDGWASDITYRFRYDRSLGKLMLIGFDNERYDRTTTTAGHKSSENYLTGWRIDYAKSLRRESSSYSETRRTKINHGPVSFEDAHFVDDPDNDSFRPF